jgi:Ni/Co efflux regulator RcnB
MYRTVKVLLVLNLLALSAILARPFVVAPIATAQSSTKVQDKDNQELVRLMDADQADRTPDDAKSIDWKIVGPRDAARLSRVKELYSKNQLQTGGDYYHAAMILQHGDVAEDYLLIGPILVKITVQVASGFPPGPAIGLSPLYSSSWQRSFPTRVRGL